MTTYRNNNYKPGRPETVERTVTPRPIWNACQYRDPHSGEYCGAETHAGSAYCDCCKPKTAPLGRARWSILETSKGLMG